MTTKPKRPPKRDDSVRIEVAFPTKQAAALRDRLQFLSVQPGIGADEKAQFSRWAAGISAKLNAGSAEATWKSDFALASKLHSVLQAQPFGQESPAMWKAVKALAAEMSKATAPKPKPAVVVSADELRFAREAG